jgi:hypothetical protein
MSLSRRQLLLAGLATARLRARPQAPPPLFDRGFARVTQIADGIYATIADPAKDRSVFRTAVSSPAAMLC